VYMGTSLEKISDRDAESNGFVFFETVEYEKEWIKFIGIGRTWELVSKKIEDESRNK